MSSGARRPGGIAAAAYGPIAIAPRGMRTGELFASSASVGPEPLAIATGALAGAAALVVSGAATFAVSAVYETGAVSTAAAATGAEPVAFGARSGPDVDVRFWR